MCAQAQGGTQDGTQVFLQAGVGAEFVLATGRGGSLGASWSTGLSGEDGRRRTDSPVANEDSNALGRK